ncbi:nitrous oxide reductase accessory protein NosL [Cribrihabitans sp. XS_ASV171]
MRALVLIAALALSACKEEAAILPLPVEMTDDALGFYCQMAIAEHDGPKGQAHLDGIDAPIFFSQVRDAIAYMHMPEQNHDVAVVYVQDMTAATWAQPGDWIRADEAFFVEGSGATGGMGAPEFVPFSDRVAAEGFARKHGGRALGFTEIRPGDVLGVQRGGAAPDATDINARLKALGQ